MTKFSLNTGNDFYVRRGVTKVSSEKNSTRENYLILQDDR